MAIVRALVIGLPLALARPALPVELEWDAPRQCPSRSEVLDRIAAYVASEPDELTEVRAVAEVRASAEGRFSLALRVTANGSEEHRRLADDTCEGLAEVAALWIAIAVSPVIAEAPAPTTPPPPATDDAVRTLEPKQRERRRKPEKPGVLPPRITARVRAGGGLGPHPVSGELSASLAAAWPVVRVEVFGRYAIPRRLTILDSDALGVNVSMWAVGGALCASAPLRPRLSIPLCAAVEVGQLIGRPFGLDNERPALPVWAGASASASLRGFVAARVALWLSPELVVALARPTLRVSGLPYPVFEAALVGGRLLAGVEVVLW